MTNDTSASVRGAALDAGQARVTVAGEPSDVIDAEGLDAASAPRQLSERRGRGFGRFGSNQFLKARVAQ